MDKHIANFPNQLREALQIAEKANIVAKQVDHVLISGLGGSGIGGSLVADWISSECKVPVLVNKDYGLPSFVGPSSLVIISSYSGNTEETIEAYQEAKKRQAQIVVISSGGKISADAEQSGITCVKVPGGNPPRTCLGYSVVQVLNVLNAFGFIAQERLKEIQNSLLLLEEKQTEIHTEAKQVAEKLFGKIPVIYALGNLESVAVRFRQQINENSKMLCWHHVFPEMNHNELVGWTKANHNLGVVILRTDYDYSRTVKRVEICEDIFRKYTSTVFEIKAKGKSLIEQSMYLIHLTDWVSWYLAEMNKVDAVEVNVIDYLKNELSKC